MLLRQRIDQMVTHLNMAQLFPVPVTIHFRPDQDTCEPCNVPLQVQKTRLGKRAATLAIGEFAVHETVLRCPACASVYHSEELRGIIPSGANFGYDIIVFVGRMLFLQCKGFKEIREALRERNILLSASEIAVLAKRFVLYLGMLHRSLREDIQAAMQLQGGYILHLDGTCEGASPHLISVLDGMSEIVLENRKLASENAEDLEPFLQGIRSQYGDPVAVVSDMGKGFALAITGVFPSIPAFICHFHFLKALGTELLGEEHDSIRASLRFHKVRTSLLATRKRLGNMTATGGLDAVIEGVAGHPLSPACPLGEVPAAAAYALISWALDSGSEGDGLGFPFDQSYLEFYRRIVELYMRMQELFPLHLRRNWRETRCYGWVLHDLHGVIMDTKLRATAARMEEKVIVFTRLRTAMRIALPQQKKGLNDAGEMPANMKTIAREVQKFCSWLARTKEYPKTKAYQKLVEKIDTYKDQLFADPIVVSTLAGKMLIQPQRTNNIMERFFRMLMRGFRKRNGFNSVERILKAMLPDTPLVMNLNNDNYMRMILGEGKTLEQRFAELDIQQVRSLQKQSAFNSRETFPQVRKIIRLPNLPLVLISFLRQVAS
jgi:hypothetical protein